MNNKDAIKVLHYHQKWRRGAKIAMLDPKIKYTSNPNGYNITICLTRKTT